EAADRQVLLVLAGAVEPAVVGDIDQEIRGRFPILAPGVLPGDVRVSVLVADQDAEMVSAQRKPGPLFAGMDAVIEIIRGQRVHPRQPVSKRNILPERDQVHLVVASTFLSLGLNQDGRIVPAWPFVRSKDRAGHSQESVGLPALGGCPCQSATAQFPLPPY